MLFLLYFFIQSSTILGKSLMLSDIKEFQSLERNCGAKQSFSPVNAKLINLIALFRHGDRAPLRISDKIWESKSCINCESNCLTIPCKHGMLTKKGYIQAKKLGEYIKKTYFNQMNKLKALKGLHSGYDRAISTLHGVVLGINDSNIKYTVAKEDSIVSNSNHKILKNIIISNELRKFKDKKIGDYKLYDELLVNYCTQTPLDCSLYDCDAKSILSFINKQQKEFLEYSDIVKSNMMSLGLSLGTFGVFLSNEIQKTGNITLVSGHDSLIVKVMNGLNIDIKKFPAYISVIFMETWQDQSNNRFIRVIYDGEVQKYGLYNEEYISVENFVKYLEMLNNSNKNVEKAIGNRNIREYSKSEISNIISNAYKPLLKAVKKYKNSSNLVGEDLNSNSDIIKVYLTENEDKKDDKKGDKKGKTETKNAVKEIKTETICVKTNCNKEKSPCDKAKTTECDKAKSPCDKSNNTQCDKANITPAVASPCSNVSSCNKSSNSPVVVSPCDKAKSPCDKLNTSPLASSCGNLSPCDQSNKLPVATSPCDQSNKLAVKSPCDQSNKLAVTSSCDKAKSSCENVSPCDKAKSPCENLSPCDKAATCSKEKSPCGSGYKNSSFDQKSGTCTMFDSTSCESYKQLLNSSTNFKMKNLTTPCTNTIDKPKQDCKEAYYPKSYKL